MSAFLPFFLWESFRRKQFFISKWFKEQRRSIDYTSSGRITAQQSQSGVPHTSPDRWKFPRWLITSRLLCWEKSNSIKQTIHFLADAHSRHGPRCPSQKDCHLCLDGSMELEPRTRKSSTCLSLPEYFKFSQPPRRQAPHCRHWLRRSPPSPHLGRKG